ncbi:MAG: hypothetical protein U0163_20485 [Gemmatimonadaceae bacterium]
MTLLQFASVQLAVIVTWLVVLLSLAGIGLLYRRAFTRTPPDGPDAVFSIWTGYAVTLLVLQVWHLVAPISGWSTGIFVALGVVGLASHATAVRAWVRTGSGVARWPVVAVGGVLVALAANHAIGPMTLYDSGMYHLPVVDWAKAHAIVPGLGNLHGRLAFNSAGLLFAAMLDHGPWSARAFHIANSALLVAFILQSLQGWSRLRAEQVESSPADVFDAMLILPAFGLLIGSEISSLDTDMPVALMLMATASYVLRGATGSERNSDTQRASFASIGIVLAAAVCAKLSAVALAGGLFIAAAWSAKGALTDRPRTGVIAAVIPVLMGLVWMTRGVILSGYPAYPSTLLGTPVPWRVPAAQAEAEAAWIRMSAHELNHNRIVAGFDWVGAWMKELVSEVQFVFMVPLSVLLAVALGILLFVRRRQVKRAAVTVRVLLLPALLGTIFWFIAAPHPRFGMGPLWIIAAAFAAMLVDTLPAELSLRELVFRRAGLTLMGGALVIVIGLGVGGSGGPSSRRGGARAIGGLIFPPAGDSGLYAVGKALLVSYTTTSGLRLVVPKDNNLCWHAALLCTPHPAPNVRLRDPADVGRGFVADGPWAPIRWPNPWTPFRPWLACRVEGGTPNLGKDRACITRTAKVPTDTLDRLTVPLTRGDSATTRAPG